MGSDDGVKRERVEGKGTNMLLRGVGLGDFHSLLASGAGTEGVLVEAARRVDNLLGCAHGTYYFQDSSGQWRPVILSAPGYYHDRIQGEFERLVDQGRLEKCLAREMPLRLPAGDGEGGVLLAPMGTEEGVRALFLGLLDETVGDPDPDDLCLVACVMAGAVSAMTGTMSMARHVDPEDGEPCAGPDADARLRAICSSMMDVYFELDLEGTMLEVSQSLERVTQYQRSELLGQKAALFFEDQAKFQGLFGKLVETGSLHEAEIAALDKDGSRKWYGVDAEIKYDENGKPVGITGALHDETALKHAEHLARSTEARFRYLVENVRAIILRWDADGLVTYFNDFALEFFGYTEEEVLGRSLVGLIVPPEDVNGRDLEAMLADIPRNPEKYAQNENENMLKDGSRVWITWSNQPVLGENGELLEILSVGTNITARKALELELRNARDVAEEANRAKSEFLANMSHEIRTPLNGVLGMLQLMNTTSMSAEQTDYVATALESGRSLLAVINDILDISKIEAGKMNLDPHRFDVKRLVDGVLNAFRHQADQVGVLLEARLDEQLPGVLMGDSGRLRQILFNLVGNAMKFTTEGEVILAMDLLETKESSARVLFRVSDTGIGIPEDKVNFVFDTFTQIDGSFRRKYQGSGLGLPIVKRLVELMNGTISITSRVNRGTTVTFSVELGVIPCELLRECAAEPELPRAASRKRLLLAEDNKVNRLMVQRILEKAGYEVVCVCSGRDAVAAVSAGELDGVIMDIQMPDMDGMDATRRIRAGEAGKDHSDIPIVAITAHAMDGDKDTFLEAGMNAYLAKPFEASDLLRMLERILGAPKVTP